MANTFVQLNDTPSNYQFGQNKFLRVNSNGTGIQFWDIELDYLADVQATNAYAPGTGDTLIYSADGKWRPGTLDVYSAGNGLNKNGLVLNVQASIAGGLESDSAGIQIADIANVSGVWGNASHIPVVTINSKGQVTAVTPTQVVAESATTITDDFVSSIQGTSGQIRVTNGTGNAANAVIDLVATGVTAATYGNATTIPQITVDSYGRVQNVDLVELVNSGTGEGEGISAGDAYNLHKYFKTFRIGGVRNENNEVYGVDVSAEKPEDIIYIESLHDGLVLQPNANTDAINFNINAGAIVSDASVGDLSDIDTTGIANGQGIIWDATANKFVPGSVVQDVTLPDSGVTAGTYGSSTKSARFTVDSKGRVTAVTETNIPQGDITSVTAGTGLIGGGTSGAVTLSVAGITVNQLADNSVIKSNEAFTDTDSAVMTAAAIADKIESYGYSTGEGLIENVYAGAGLFENVVGSSVTINMEQTGVTPGTYGNALVYPRITVDALGRITDISSELDAGASSGVYQVLSYNAGTNSLSISNGNNVDLSALEQTLALSGNVITISGSNSTVDLTPILGTSNAGTDSQTLSLSENNLSISNGNSVDLSGLTVDLTGYATEAYVDSQISNVDVDLTGYATETYVNTAVDAILDGANINLDTLAEVANALGNSNTAISTVAFTGDYTDLTNRPTLTFVGTDLSYDGTTVDLSSLAGQDGVDGAQGPKGDTGDTGDTGATGPAGAAGTDGISITSAQVTNGDFIITYSNTSVQNLGDITGPQGIRGEQGIQGPAGADGSDGLTVTGASVVSSDLIITLSDSSTINAGNVIGPKGDTGETGPQGDTGETGPQGIQGIQGETGPQGIQGIQGETGPQGPAGSNGADGIQLSDISVTEAAPSGNGSLAYNNSTGVLTFTPADVNSGGGSADTGNITFSGDTISTSGNGILMSAGYVNMVATGSSPIVLAHGSNSWLFNADGTLEVPGDIVDVNGNSVLGDPDQTLSLVGSTLTISGSNSSVDLSSLGGGSGGTTYTSGTGIVVDNTEDTIALANTTVTAGTYGSSTKSARFTVDAQGRITNVTEATISGGGSNSGSGATIERFKLNYASNGNLAGTAELSAGIASVTIDSTTGGEVTIQFDSGYYNMPPGAVMMYGYDYTNNNYIAVPLDTSNGFRLLPGGGSSGSPTLFDGAGSVTIKIRLRETETGSSRGGFGTTTHAWVQFVMYD